MIEPEARLARRPWTRLEVATVALIVLGGGLVRFVNLGDPPGIMFDETYYAKDACWYVETSKGVCDVDHEQTMVHPPLGKWLLAIGIRVFGYDSFGWRFAAALAGSVTIALLYLLARRLLRHRAAAALAAGLLAIDFLHFVQSRIAMIDIFVPMFGIAALLFAVYDRDKPLPGHPARLAAGVASGAAVASKWSGVFFVVLVVLLSLAWEFGRRRGQAEGRTLRRTLREEGPSILLGLVVVPLVLYVATYAGRLDGALVAAPWSEGSFWRAVWDQQFSMFDFHAVQLSDTTHPYQSPPWSWLLLKRPVSYFFETNEGGEYMEVLATGSPLVWWASVPALLYVAVRRVRRRALGTPDGLVAGGFLFTYVPWLVMPVDREAVFLFYMVAAVPFMCLALAVVADTILPYTEGKIATGGFVAAAVAFFVFFYPVLAKVPLPREHWDQRIRFRDCNEKVVKDGPPKGWCWI